MGAAYWTNESVGKYIRGLDLKSEHKFLLLIKLTDMDFDEVEARNAFSKLDKNEIIQLLRR